MFSSYFPLQTFELIFSLFNCKMRDLLSILKCTNDQVLTKVMNSELEPEAIEAMGEMTTTVSTFESGLNILYASAG